MARDPPIEVCIMILHVSRPVQAVPVGANSSVELVLLSLCSALFHHIYSDLPWGSIVSLKSLHLLCVSNREGENWVWTVLLICFPYRVNTIPTPLLHNTRAASARGRLFLTAEGLGVLRVILVAGKFYVLTSFCSQTNVLQVRMQELTHYKTVPSGPHGCQQPWIVKQEVCMMWASVTVPCCSSYRRANKTVRDWQLFTVPCSASNTQKTWKHRWEKHLL